MISLCVVVFPRPGAFAQILAHPRLRPPPRLQMPSPGLPTTARNRFLQQNIFGGVDTKKYIIETTGTGVAIFDYDNDGWPDIFIVNGTKLEFSSGQGPSNRLYRNNHDGTFTDVTVKAGLTSTGWGQGVCVGDYDNDGWEDLYITYYGKNRLYHNKDGVFTEVAEKSGVAGSGKAWGTGCAFVDYDRDGHLDLIVANYVDFDLATAPAPGDRPTVSGRAFRSCAVRGECTWSKSSLSQPRRRHLRRHNEKAHIDRTNGHYGFSVSTFDFDEDGWPDIFVACDSTPSILYRNNHDGTFIDVAVTAGAAFNEDGPSRQAWVRPSAITTATDIWIFSRQISPTILQRYMQQWRRDIHATSPPPPDSACTRKYLGWGTMFFDFDNDGWPDLMLVNGHVYPEVDRQHLGSGYEEPRILYHNHGTAKFKDISSSAGPGITMHSSARGLAIGDLWNDGKLSAVISNMNSTPSLLDNQIRTPNHGLRLRPKGQNRIAMASARAFGSKPKTAFWSTKFAADRATIPTAIAGSISASAHPQKFSGSKSAGLMV